MLKPVSLLALVACSALSPARGLAQQPAAPTPQTKTAKSAARKPAAEVDPMAEIQRTGAVSLISALADEARAFRDPALRARVQARAADVLWATERERAATLFRRAWEEAEAADADADRRVAEEKNRQRGERGSFSVQLPPSLRAEVLRLAAKRDRTLGEEFLTRLDEARKREAESAATSNTAADRTADAAPDAARRPERPDPMDTPPAIAQRLRLAIQLLDSDVERAIQFADPALGAVTPPALEFLARLRQKNAPAADERYLALVNRAGASPASDANTASLLSSYIFSPSLFMVFSADAGSSANTWTRPGATTPPADVAPQLRAAYFRTAAAILLRPTPTPDQDFTSAGRAGWYMVIARLMPLFDQHAPDRSPALRAKMASLAPDTPDGVRRPEANNALTRGLVPEDPNRDRLGETLGRLDRAKTAAERDAVYVDAVLDALRQKDPRLDEFVGKIEDADTRRRLRAYVDFEATRDAVSEKDAAEVLRLARLNTLTSIQRAWALTEAARLYSKAEPGRAVEILDEALTEARERIDPASKERVSALVAVATQLVEIDRARAWEVMLDVVKASNSAKEYTGEDGRMSTRFESRGMTMISSSSAQSFDLADIFSKLAAQDMQRAADLARGFDGEAPRAFATLAVARSVLDRLEKKPARERAAN